MSKQHNGAKSMVMQRLFKMRVQKDKTKYNKKDKHKSRLDQAVCYNV